MISTSLERRLRRIETQRSATAIQITIILAGTEEDAAQQIAEREAAGTYKPGQPLMILTGRPTEGAQP